MMSDKKWSNALDKPWYQFEETNRIRTYTGDLIGIFDFIIEANKHAENNYSQHMHIGDLEKIASAAKEEIEKLQEELAQKTAQVEDANKTIKVYANTGNWYCDELACTSWFDCIMPDDVDDNEIGGKSAREYEAKWIKGK